MNLKPSSPGTRLSSSPTCFPTRPSPLLWPGRSCLPSPPLFLTRRPALHPSHLSMCRLFSRCYLLFLKSYLHFTSIYTILPNYRCLNCCYTFIYSKAYFASVIYIEQGVTMVEFTFSTADTFGIIPAHRQMDTHRAGRSAFSGTWESYPFFLCLFFITNKRLDFGH